MRARELVKFGQLNRWTRRRRERRRVEPISKSHLRDLQAGLVSLLPLASCGKMDARDQLQRNHHQFAMTISARALSPWLVGKLAQSGASRSLPAGQDDSRRMNVTCWTDLVLSLARRGNNGCRTMICWLARWTERIVGSGDKVDNFHVFLYQHECCQ